MDVKKININQSELTYNIASDIYDVSAHNDGATFESLSTLLSDENLPTIIPLAVRYGGMTIRFVLSSDNKYVQYRLMANSWSTTVADWLGVDDEPIIGSDNFVKSGGVADAIESESARATAAEEANANAIHKGVDVYFAFRDLTLTDTQISFIGFSFVYVKDSLSDKYVRYIIKQGTYDLPNASNLCLYVTPSIADDSGNLIPTVSTEQVQDLKTDCYIIGIYDSIGKFLLSDAASIYKVNANAIQANTYAIQANANAIQALSYTATEEKVVIDATLLRYNTGCRLLDDGTLLTVEGNYYVVSDFIEISAPIKHIVAVFNDTEIYGHNAAFAFYSDNNEESFISSWKNWTSVTTGGWKIFKGVPTVPKNAKYIRISSNTAINSEAPAIYMYNYTFPEYGHIYSEIPEGGYEYFTYDVDTSKDDIEDAEQSSNILYPSVISKDNGLIRIPPSYTRNGKPTRLVIINHGAGGQVTDNSAEGGNSTTALLLQKKGYAVLFINGVPEAMRNTKYMAASNNGAAAHMGGWVYIRSALAAYKYVTDKYNIAKDGCFITGGSMGGVTTLNLAMSGAIPVKAIALSAPVIDSFHDAYFSGNWSSGTLGGGTPAIFAWIFQWDYCDFENDTYTIPVGTYNIFGQSFLIDTEETKPIASLRNNSQDMAILWYLNENKMQGYNGYRTGDFLYKNLDESHVYDLSTDNDDDYFAKKLPAPCKIWFGGGDNVNQISIAKRFINKCRKGGSIAMLRTCPTSIHGPWGVTTDYDGNDIRVEIGGEKHSPYNIELLNWLDRWNGDA